MYDGYGIDLEAFSLEALYDVLAHDELLPSHQVLRENLAAHFAALAAHGITNVQQLVDTLTTRTALERFAGRTGVPVDYLTLLRRHVRGYIPRPVNLTDIPGLDAEVVGRLAAVGIKHTRHLFAQARTRAARTALAQQLDIAEPVMEELIQLTDLARIGWVGPIGVRLFHDAGAHTAAVLKSLDPEAFHARVMAINQERQYTNVRLGRKDIALVLKMASKLPSAIAYEEE